MVANESLKTKEKSSWVIPKVVAVAYGSFSLQSVSHSSRRGFTKVVVTKAGRLRERSTGDLLLYINYTKSKINGQIE